MYLSIYVSIYLCIYLSVYIYVYDYTQVRQTDTHATHTKQLLCDAPATAFPQKIMLLKTHRWLPFLPANPNNQALLTAFGSVCVSVFAKSKSGPLCVVLYI